MDSPTSLHALVYCTRPQEVTRFSAILSALYPESHVTAPASVAEALESLDRSAFDLVVLVFDEAGSAHRPVLDRLREHAVPMPVAMFIHSKVQSDAQRYLDNSDADWEVGLHDCMEDSNVEAVIRRAVRVHELKWERDHLERALESSVHQYRNLFDEIPDVIFVCDRSGTLLDVNPTASRMFGKPKSNLLLKSIFDAFGMETAAFDRLVDQATRGAGPIEDIEVTYRLEPDLEIHGLTHMVVWNKSPGGGVRFQGVIKDITGRKRLESRLRSSETKYRTLYEMGQVSSSSLQLERVGQEAIELIVENCRALGGVLLVNVASDDLRAVASVGGGNGKTKGFGGRNGLHLGRDLIGRWAISGGTQMAERSEFPNLEKSVADWVREIGAGVLVGFPLSSSDLSVPASILLLGFSNDDDLGDPELIKALTGTLEMGLNNCFHYSSAREAEKKYRELWEYAPAYFITLLQGGVIFEINQTAAQALGYRLQDMIGRPMTDFVHADDRARLLDNHRRVVQRMVEASYEVRLIRRDGSQIVVTVSSEPLRNSEGTIIGETAVLHDITRDRELEVSLRNYSKTLESEVAARTQELTSTMNFLEGILEGASEYGIFGLDESGGIIHCNRGASQLFGFEEGPNSGEMSLDSLFARDTNEKTSVAALLEEAKTEGVTVNELTAHTRSGEALDIHLTVNHLAELGPDELAYVAIARDVTEQKRIEGLLKDYTENLEAMIEEKTEELNQKHVQLIQSSKLATLGEMATGIAHELNQPLSGIRTRAELLARLAKTGNLGEERIIKGQNEIVDLVDRITKIIQHMRVFSRQDQQPFMPFYLTQSLDGCMSLLGEQLRTRGVEIKIEIDPDLPLIFGESSQIEQVLINLVANARDALEERAEAELETMGEGPRFVKKIKIELRREGEPAGEGNDLGEVLMRVSDNGPGMDARTRERIFQPFFTTKPIGKGTGLGLSISYGILLNHKARIDVTSEPGEGTIFDIRFPVCAGGAFEHPAINAMNETVRRSS